MDRKFVLTAFGYAIIGLALSSISAHSQTESWTKIETPGEVRQLIVDKVLDGKYWKFYFRSDGIMAYEQDGFTVFREWKINADGERVRALESGLYYRIQPDRSRIATIRGSE